MSVARGAMVKVSGCLRSSRLAEAVRVVVGLVGCDGENAGKKAVNECAVQKWRVSTTIVRQ